MEPVTQAHSIEAEVKDLRPGPWVVSGGHVDVVFVQRSAEGAIRPPVYLGRLQPGAFCVGAPATPGLQLCLRVPDASRIVRPESAGLSPIAMRTGLEQWVRLLAAAPHRAALPKSSLLVRPGSARIEAFQVLHTHNRYMLIEFERGMGYLYGRRSPAALIQAGTIMPLAPHTWISARSEAAIRSTEFSSAADSQLLRAAEALSSITLRLLHQDSVNCDRVEHARSAERARADRRLVAQTCEALGSLLRPAEQRSGDADPLEEALRLVAGDRGLTLADSLPPTGARTRVRIREIARLSGFRMRRIALRGKWWKSDCGPILGCRLGEEGEEPSPVAIRRSGRFCRYEVWDVARGVRIAVGTDTSQSLSPFGYTLYRPLAGGDRVGKQVLQLGLVGASRDLWVVLVLGLIAGGLAALTPILTARIYDQVIPEADRGHLTQLWLLLLSVGLSAACFQLVRAVAILRIETRLDDAVQAAVWDRLLSLPARFFRDYTAGDLAMRASGVGVMRQMLSRAVSTAMLTGIFSCWYAGLLFYYDPWTATLVLVLVATVAGLSGMLSMLQFRHQRRATRMQSELSGTVFQFITGLAKLRVAGAEVRAFARWGQAFARQRRAHVAGLRSANLLLVLQACFPIALMIVVYHHVAGLSEGELTTGAFLALHTAMLALAGTVVSLTAVFTAVASAAPLYEQVRPILTGQVESTGAREEPEELRGGVELRHVSFRYSSEGPLVLDDVSLRADPGAFIALVGPSGSGKSSVLRLLLLFEEPASGSIYFDGQDASGLEPVGLRRQLGVVLQDGQVLTGDVYTNIAGSSDATMDEVWEAARLAGLADDIKAMPMGMHTVINEGGSTISGGQRQRLMIARAIVHRPRILLFDEATSALDNVTQRVVSDSLAGLEATRIVVAHRLSTIIAADRIYVLDRGRVVEQGNYDELMARGGVFCDLARRQLVESGGAS